MGDELSKYAPKRQGPMPVAFPPPPTPQVKYPDDAEVEIRRSLQRHYDQLAQIATLQTDRDHYKNRTELAEAVVEKLKRELADEQALNDELRDTITTLTTRFETGVDIWLQSYEILKSAAHVKIINTPKQLLEKKDEPASNRED